MAYDTLQQLQQGGSTQEQAIALYDALETVDCDFMLGRWRGEEFRTGTALDGMLERCGWYGKEFVDRENVHPLLFETGRGRIVALNPGLMPLSLALKVPALNGPASAAAFRAMRWALITRRSRARLRMTEYRGKVSATMVYDQLPINDVFRKVDDDTVLGAMDLKGMELPYFFVLRRER